MKRNRIDDYGKEKSPRINELMIILPSASSATMRQNSLNRKIKNIYEVRRE